MKKNRLFHLAFLLVAVLLAQDSRAQTTLKGHTGRVESMKTSALTSESANSDSVALVALYNATNGPSWRNKTNWLSNQPLGEWEGVSTENVGHVYELRLERNRLSGEIPSELGNLTNLRYLVLNQNRLSGEIPSELGNLANLRYLELDQNRLSGEIPAELGNLTNLERLVLSDNQLTGTIPKELGNLTNLTHLELDDNQLSTLPDSLFAGLSSLAVLRLDGNSVDPLPLAVSLEQVGADQVKAVAPTGAPFEIVLPISVTNGSLSGGATTLTIPVGSVESAPLTVVRTPGTTAAVTVDIGPLPGLPTDHAGYALAKASDRPLEVLSSTVGTVGDSGDQQPEQPQQPEVPGGEGGTPTTLCDRTPQVRDAIVAAVPSVSDCNDVTQTQLATGITSLFLNGQSITTLKADDFAGLTSLVELRLYDNQLSTLPADLFDGLSSLTTLYLNGNQLSSLPEGLFDGLSSLATLYLYGNSVDPLPLTLSLEQVGADQVKAVAPIGAPFEIVLPISVTNGRLSGGATTLTIPAGSVASASLTVVSTPGTTAAITVDIGTLPRLPTNHVGYALVKASDLPLEVISTLANTAPVFTDGASTTRTIAENTTAGVNIGTAIAATDADHDVLTYTLRGTDAAAFNIESTTGQLQTKAALDYETKSAYSVVVTVSDGTLTDTIIVPINVTDLEEALANTAPVFTDGASTTRTIAENTTAGVNIGTAIAATDADHDVLTYTLRGTDAAAFNIDSTTGQLRTKAALDYETKSIYTVTVSVSDGRLTDTITVTITVTDIEEVEEGGDQQPEQPEQPAAVDRRAFESSTPAGYTQVTLSKTGGVWGVPTKFTEDSNEGKLAFMVLGKLKGCSFANAEAAQQSKVYIKIQDLGRQSNYVSETVCGTTTHSYSSWQGFRITHLRFFDESSPSNIKEAVYNAATGQIEISGESIVQQPEQPEQSPPYARAPAQDFNTLSAARNDFPSGLWSDGTTMWVADYQDDKLYAYNLSTKARDPNKDFNTLIAAGNTVPDGLWSDGTTMWVTGHEDNKLYAYNLSTKARDPNKDFNTLIAAGNNVPAGLWSDGTTMWVADWEDNKLYAYNLSTKARDPDKDFNTLDATGNNAPAGLWSDGTTMWVTDYEDNKLYAYNLSTKFRDPDKDFNTLDATGNNAPVGLWSDGTTMWVADYEDNKLYAYHMPSTPAAKAQALIGLPEKTQLQPNAPNPFNSETVLSYFLLEPGPARLELFSMIGQRVAVLRQGHQQAGYHRLRWNGRDDAGRPLASGIYLYRLVTDEGILTRKLVLLR